MKYLVNRAPSPSSRFRDVGTHRPAQWLSLLTLLVVGMLLVACNHNAPTPILLDTVVATPDTSTPTDAAAEILPTPTDAPTATEEEVAAPADSSSAPVADDAVAGATNTAAGETASSDTVDAIVVPAPAPFDPVQTVVGLETVVSGLNRPLFATHAGDGTGRIFVVEQPGTIRIVQDGVLQPTAFLDIQDRVNDGASEQGLLGLAFPPNFSETGWFFVDYTDSQGATNVARFQVVDQQPDVADPTSEMTVLQIDQPAGNHNGGMLLFGPDGYLWIGTGDGGASNDRFGNGQNPDTLLGKMLRIDVLSDPSQPYTIPADNPWVNQDWNDIDVRDEIWAVGLRNPWRYSFDRATGDLWIGDVGQNQYEEVNYVDAATVQSAAVQPLNFGWPIMEATHCFGSTDCDGAGLEIPVAEYDHSGNCSVTGGYVYRGQQFSGLNGVYFYGDYCSGIIWALTPDPAGGWKSDTALRTGLSLSSFGEDEQGELYVTDRNGTLSRLVVE